MWEVLLKNKTTGEEDVIWEYNVKDTFRRNPELNPDDWEILSKELWDE